MSRFEPFLRPADIAEYLKLNLLTIYKYIRSGELKAIKFGRSYRVSEKDLEKFIKKNMVKKI